MTKGIGDRVLIHIPNIKDEMSMRGKEDDILYGKKDEVRITSISIRCMGSVFTKY